MLPAADVLEALCRRLSASRAEVGQDTGLSPATISRAVVHLRRLGLISEEGLPGQGVGRPPGVIHLRPDAAHVVGIDAGGSQVRVVLANLAGELQARETTTVHRPHDFRGFLQTVRTLVCAIADRTGAQVAACAVGVSGIVDVAEGAVLLSPDLPGLTGRPVAAGLSETLKMPVAIDNDDLLAASGEVAFGAARGCTDVVFLSIGHGLGAGLIVGGHPVHGARSSAGAIAFIGSDRLDDRASGRAIPARYRERRRETETAPSDSLTAGMVFDLAARGDPDAMAVVEEVQRALGELVVDVGALLDPEIVVLGGGLIRGQPGLVAAMMAHLAGSLPFPPRLAVSELGEDAVARGAVGLALTLAHRRLVGARAQPGTFGGVRFVPG